MQSRAFDASTPPIAIKGTRTARQMRSSSTSPSGGAASSFDGVAQFGPTPG
jgi:hypothetical protein